MIDQYFNRFKYKLGEMENPQEYVEKYGEAYEFVLKDEVHRRYYEGNNRIIYRLLGRGELYLYYGENFSYETYIVEGDFKVYSIIQPENFALIHREFNVKGKLELRTIGIGGYLNVKHDINLFQNASADDRGIGFTRSDQLAYYTSNLNHLESNTKSYSHYRGIVNDQSYIRLDGMINISKNATQSESFLDQHIMLLQDSANAFAFPALKIENNMVKASHSATISKLPEEMLFYLETRGISRKESIGMLIGGFINKVMDVDEKTYDIISQYIN
ncbi:MAG: SufD family Fe-S cluster assembly protein [Candidatus Anstonellales archaeon]